jgi:hypothetical protein
VAAKCSACGKPVDPAREGVELWGAWFCPMCFLSQSRSLHRELTPGDADLMRAIGAELSGLLPPEVFEMILTGFHRRATGGQDPPPREALLFTMAELQRLYAINNFQREIKLLRTWNDMFSEFLEARQREIQETVRRLTGADE